jgi:hypothetical protein
MRHRRHCKRRSDGPQPEALEISSQGGFATRMFTNVGKEFPRADGDIPRLVGLLLENGVRLAA